MSLHKNYCCTFWTLPECVPVVALSPAGIKKSIVCLCYICKEIDNIIQTSFCIGCMNIIIACKLQSICNTMPNQQHQSTEGYSF